MPSERKKLQYYRGKYWRAERKDAHPIYARMEQFLEANPGVPLARLMDLALAKFFDRDPRIAALFQAEMLVVQPRLDFLDEAQ